MTKKAYFISIFPTIFNVVLNEGITKKSLTKGIIDFEVVNPMDFLKEKERLDDVTYGGGPGMLLKALPLIESIDFCKKKIKKRFKSYLFKSSRTFV